MTTVTGSLTIRIMWFLRIYIGNGWLLKWVILETIWKLRWRKRFCIFHQSYLSVKIMMLLMITVVLWAGCHHTSHFQMTYSLTRFGMYEQLKKQFPGGFLSCLFSTQVFLIIIRSIQACLRDKFEPNSLLMLKFNPHVTISVIVVGSRAILNVKILTYLVPLSSINSWK